MNQDVYTMMWSCFVLPSLQVQVCSLFYSTSEVMYEVLDESLQRAEMNHNITYGMYNVKFDLLLIWLFEII